MSQTSGTVRRIAAAERRARLGRRQGLAVPAADPTAVARSMVALHGTDPTTVYLSVWARTPDVDVPAVERALYEDRSLVRLLAMRRTVFVVTRENAPVVLAAASRGVAARQRRMLLGWLSEAGVADDVAVWLNDVETVAMDALKRLGEATAAELGKCDPRLRTEIVLSQGKSYEGMVRVSSRILLLLAAEGQVMRGRPLGSWTSTQFKWAPVETWFPGGLPRPSVQEAETELARLWLATFGPGTVDDVRWWTGWSLTQTRKVLSRLDTVQVDLDGEPGLVLADDVEPEPEPEPWVALLPALDPTPMGWSGRDFYLGEHGPLLFDRNGNVSPTVWADGRIVGGWAQRADGEVVFRLLDAVGRQATQAIEEQAAALAKFLGPVRLSARARAMSALERELRSP